MDLSDVQVQQAIEIAWNPASNQGLKAQAFEFLNQLRSNPSAANVCLSLFTRDPPVNEVVRHVCLEIVNNAVQNTTLEPDHLYQIRDGLLEYVKIHYGAANGQARVDTPPIQNKIAQTLTLLFQHLYKEGWQSFFDDLRTLSANGAHLPGTLLYLRVLASVHDDIADQLINVPANKQKLFTELKDLIRVRDITKITESWQGILSRTEQTNRVAVELCLKTISRWVSWVDISLIVNESSMNQLFTIASHHVPDGDEQGTKVRDAAIDVFTEIVAKKMKAADKVGLIRFLNLNEVVNRLRASPGLNDDARGRPEYDTDMAERVAKLVNGVMFDLVKILEASEASAEVRQQAEQSAQQFMNHLLHFFADEYDEVCSTVIPSLTDLLGLFRKLASARGSLPAPYTQMLQPTLDAIIAKMRYDDTSSWGEEGEETDEAEFQELRKRLRVLQQLLATVDENRYIQTLSNIVTPIFTALKAGSDRLDWRDVDLAMLEMSLLGELATINGGLYHKKRPSSVASGKLIELMSLMMECGVASYPHSAISLNFMDICVKHTAYFEQHNQFVPDLLEQFVRFVHSTQIKVKARSHNYFLRLVRDLKSQLAPVAERAIRAIEDLLAIKAEVPDDESNDDSSSSNEGSQSADALFNSQLNLYEAIGCLASAPGIDGNVQANLAKSVLAPLTDGISSDIQAATRGDERASLQVHHLIMAAGTLARGFSDWVPGKSRAQVGSQVVESFSAAAGIILNALEAGKASMSIRSAARFAFSRMIGVLGYSALQQLPRWIDGLLAESSTKDEMATFLKLLDQVIFGFKTQISGILDNLFTPLLQRIFQGLSEPTNGTDDEIQLGELRREYLNFLLIVLGNDLDSVMVSTTNQGIFDTIISSVEHFARNTTNNPDARLAMAVLTKMTSVWGGPDIKDPTNNSSPPQPSLPGFDGFMLSRFSALTWQIMSASTFNPKEANANRELAEIAILQQLILAKTGQQYLKWTRDTELRNLGANDAMIDEYLHALITKDSKAFKVFLQSFLHRG